MTKPKATFYSEALVLELAGPDGAREFARATAEGKAALYAWLHELRAGDDADLAAESFAAIWDRTSPRAVAHAKINACHHESLRRHMEAGHSETCQGQTIYDRAYNEAVPRYAGASPAKCTCGKGDGA